MTLGRCSFRNSMKAFSGFSVYGRSAPRRSLERENTDRGDEVNVNNVNVNVKSTMSYTPTKSSTVSVHQRLCGTERLVWRRCRVGRVTARAPCRQHK
ncbi:hypothetical protein INR49_019719 [Caranx melampygus]|nr:hypothetical protein INR49_019719 [Caranx melampygus]